MEQEDKQKNIIDILDEKKAYWNESVKSMSEQLKSIGTVSDVMSTVYVKKQEANDYRNYLMRVVSDLKRKYDKKYAISYNNYKSNSNIMYKSDTAIDRQISGDLSDDKYLLSILDGYVEFMSDTISSIDGIAYSVQNRIRLEELIKGIR